MPRWLFKSEPDVYSYADLERDGATLWDGVTNALARKHLREVQPGDKIWYYHTGDEKAIVGLMVAVGGPQAGPNSDDPKAVVVEVKPVRKLKHPVSLSRIKAEPSLADWALVRNSRLSVVPVSPEQWRQVEQLVKASGAA
jgi:predicted RNA-binding protein with PUA-like domain